jgi:hypothetical protein
MTCSTTKASIPHPELHLTARILPGEFPCHHPKGLWYPPQNNHSSS